MNTNNNPTICFKRNEDKVEHVLQQYEATRNDDQLLLETVRKLFYVTKLEKTVSQAQIETIAWDWTRLIEASKVISKCTVSLDTVSRIRRKFQERGMYLPTDETVMKRRRRNEVKMHDFILDSRQ